jgi:hypothetical protein
MFGPRVLGARVYSVWVKRKRGKNWLLKISCTASRSGSEIDLLHCRVGGGGSQLMGLNGGAKWLMAEFILLWF